MAKVFLLVTLVTAASTTTHFIQPLYPRHSQPRRYNEQYVQRRNIDYHSDINVNHPHVHDTQENPEASHQHTLDCHQNQDSNRFGHSNYNTQENIEAETSTRPGKEKYPIEQINEDLAYTNVKPKVNRQESRGNIGQTLSHLPRPRDKHVLVTQRIPAVYENQERNVKTNVNPVKHNTPQKNHEPDGNQDTSTKVNNVSEEIMWIWGSDDTSESSSIGTETSTQDLDNRVAINGDSCAKGMGKVAGKCVSQI